VLGNDTLVDHAARRDNENEIAFCCFKMSGSLIVIFFFCPTPQIVESIPSDPAEYWAWICGELARGPIPCSDGKVINSDGPFSWTIYTYMQLRKAGYRVQIKTEIPEKGVVVSHSSFWQGCESSLEGQFFVEIKPDRLQALSRPDFVIVQSQKDPIIRSNDESIRPSVAFVKSWMQPSLIPRNPSRMARIENACYMGQWTNFLNGKSVPIVSEEFSNLEINFLTPSRERWHDYSEVDLIIAIRSARSFNPFEHPSISVWSKPPNKLINAWAAGVPAIVSPEPAYEAIRCCDLDYIRAGSLPEIIAGTKAIIQNHKLYFDMANHGAERAKEYSDGKIVQEWISLLEDRVRALTQGGVHKIS